MSRTHAHAKLGWNWSMTRRIASHWSNKKNGFLARDDRRRIRHAPIDEEDAALADAIREYKRDIFARDKYW